ncbi:DNA-binding response regulator, NarL/FixJ family, contains REC and HTH domains [Actinopolymorpha cephalotaxi]|uniref:DNA-binding NarL/FixJ family response regulator n=1 Tax=Actinopolymorpha cephalotaxi TaxID=504797 RepID=A0A1I2YI99_9ACTN|nr:response regulator transcription factor [Actinopolymorpha cephalotaxi]NYH86968.1 DNA-binding NarL/FixJ family response regulator [Actinopolymorpha cephalotaxi]SFH25059.1 DNA-binding response regulator, NarL/FixJ family, contains REC and HTH domains [Actinopolymorpha cephalotaxi]
MNDDGSGPGAALRVLVVDDDDLMRAGLRAVLSTDDTIEVVGEASNGREAVEQVRRLHPDVVLMDVRMPELDGIAATRTIVEAGPETRILVLTTFSDDEYVYGSLAAGASGFLLKRTRPEHLIAGIHTVGAGESLLSPAVTRTVIDRMTSQGRHPVDPAALGRLRALTPREREVLELVGRGLSNAEIAGTLFVEESTVKTHVKRLLAKLHLRDRVQAVILTYETGLVRPGEQPSAGS